MLLKLH